MSEPLIDITPVDPRSPEAVELIHALSEELARRYDYVTDGAGNFKPRSRPLERLSHRLVVIVDAAGFSTQELDAVSDTLVERLLVFGSASQIKDRLLELLERGVDELTIGPVWVSDAAQERSHLAQLIGQL